MNIAKIKSFLSEYKKVIENYIFMTVLYFFKSFFLLLIYPYVISKIGVEQYGVYVFAFSIVTVFTVFIAFGFDLPALKEVSENRNDIQKKQLIFSKVFFAKIYLLIFSTIVFYIVSLFLSGTIEQHQDILWIVYLQVLSSLFLPVWYYQAIQRMKVMVIFQCLLKILCLPFIYFLVKEKNDLNAFAWIMSLEVLLSALVAFFALIKVEKIKLQFQSPSAVQPLLKESTPFFLTNIIATIKDQGVVWILGAFFSMREVAIYDLAQKIVIVPRTIFIQLNTALFPKLINELSADKIKKLIKIEFPMGLFVIVLMLLFGDKIVYVLGNGQLPEAYIPSVILSITVATWLVVSCYINFVFLAQKKSFFVTKNQLYAFLSLWISMALGLLLYKHILVIPIAMAISACVEMLYCVYVAQRYRML